MSRDRSWLYVESWMERSYGKRGKEFQDTMGEKNVKHFLNNELYFLIEVLGSQQN